MVWKQTFQDSVLTISTISTNFLSIASRTLQYPISNIFYVVDFLKEWNDKIYQIYQNKKGSHLSHLKLLSQLFGHNNSINSKTPQKLRKCSLILHSSLFFLNWEVSQFSPTFLQISQNNSQRLKHFETFLETILSHHSQNNNQTRLIQRYYEITKTLWFTNSNVVSGCKCGMKYEYH